jgi:hypothetical protein
MDSPAASGIAVLIPPDAKKRQSARPRWQGGRYEWMRKLLATQLGERLYRKRSQTVEPMFGHTKAQPRDGPLSPTRQTRRAHRMAPDHGHPQLLKLHSHALAAATA